MPKISVIIPAYNAERYIAYCLDSVLKQTFSDFEIICVNDGSKDRTLDILNEYSRKDARVRVVNQENPGCGYSRNNGYELAKGDYIYFLDSDDAIHPQFLEVMYYLRQLTVLIWFAAGWKVNRINIPKKIILRKK